MYPRCPLLDLSYKIVDIVIQFPIRRRQGVYCIFIAGLDKTSRYTKMWCAEYLHLQRDPVKHKTGEKS